MKSIHQEKQKEIAEKKTKKSKTKPKIELKDKLSEEEYKEKKAYYDYIREILKEETIPSKIYAISENLYNKYNFSYEGMHYTLVYIREILGKELTGDIVGIIKYYYTDALQFKKKVQETEQKNQGVNVKKLYSCRTVKISSKNLNSNNEIDISSIGVENDE